MTRLNNRLGDGSPPAWTVGRMGEDLSNVPPADRLAWAQSVLSDATRTWAEVADARRRFTAGDPQLVLVWRQLRRALAAEVLGGLDVWRDSADARIVVDAAVQRAGDPHDVERVLRGVYAALSLAPAQVCSVDELTDLAVALLHSDVPLADPLP